jgi:hypothetical protein
MGGNVFSLCNKAGELRNSHILPEFLYKKLYDEKHRTLIISKEKNKVIQKGIRERLLCRDCETQFSRYEKYAKEVILRIPSFSRDKSGKILYAENINYSLFKLFQLSILWRASIAKSPMFSQVSLGPHEDIIREMLQTENPGTRYDYGCAMSIVLYPKMIDGIIESPKKLKVEDILYTIL